MVAGSFVAVTQSITEVRISKKIPTGTKILRLGLFSLRSVIVTHIMIEEIKLIKTNEVMGAHKLIPNYTLPPQQKI